ncbi:hypothetical protein B484DRAFT_389456, partial [Ochromonadaceae sp. CCMP2298]
MCEGQLGNVPSSLLAHSQALKGDPKFREARLNLGRRGLAVIAAGIRRGTAAT